MSTRFLAGLLALAIAWVGLFSLEYGQQDVEAHSDIAATFVPPAPDPGSVVDHHLDDLPLQTVDSGLDLPDHQPIARNGAKSLVMLAPTPPCGALFCATVFLEGPLRPPISLRSRA
ncbi:hypothetical protein WG922_02615 [Ramlibacter sp. AN1015]|uniref:hypothetical protein n=1 Tax=Ramlibacter sp. AN1015 TaxID=3133428 RepID=UPI0030C08642